MLKGSRAGILRKIQPISIHGQISWDVFFNDVDDPEGPVLMARVGPEAVHRGLEPGDLIRLEYLLGAVTSVTRLDEHAKDTTTKNTRGPTTKDTKSQTTKDTKT